MSHDQPPVRADELLLDYQLGHLDDEACRELERRLAGDADLQARHRRLGQALQPLETWTVAPPSGELVQSVMSRIEQAGPAEPEIYAFDQAADKKPSWLRSALSVREALAVAASILIIVGIFVPSYYRDRSGSTAPATPTQAGGLVQPVLSPNESTLLPQGSSSWRLPAVDGVDGPRRVRLQYVNPKLRVLDHDGSLGLSSGDMPSERLFGVAPAGTNLEESGQPVLRLRLRDQSGEAILHDILIPLDKLRIGSEAEAILSDDVTSRLTDEPLLDKPLLDPAMLEAEGQ